MKIFLTLILAINMAACSTSAGFVRGVGEDVKSATDWTASKIKSN
jgi:predicted small secreted protein